MPSTRAKSAQTGCTDPSPALVDVTNDSGPSTSFTAVPSKISKSVGSKSVTHKRSVNTSDEPERASKRLKPQITSSEPMSLEKKKEMLEARFFRNGYKIKCYGCRVNGLKMPEKAIRSDEKELLQCGCKKEEALVEAVFVYLNLVGKEVAEKKKCEGELSGWKAVGKPERQRQLKVLKMLGMGLDDLLGLVDLQ